MRDDTMRVRGGGGDVRCAYDVRIVVVRPWTTLRAERGQDGKTSGHATQHVVLSCRTIQHGGCSSCCHFASSVRSFVKLRDRRHEHLLLQYRPPQQATLVSKPGRRRETMSPPDDANGPAWKSRAGGCWFPSRAREMRPWRRTPSCGPSFDCCLGSGAASERHTKHTVIPREVCILR